MYNSIYLLIPSLFIIVNALQFEYLDVKPFNCEVCFSFWGAWLLFVFGFDPLISFIISLLILRFLNDNRTI
jgi:hypothetical protein